MKALEDSTLQVILDSDEILWESIREKIKIWYDFHKRNLPWRNTQDPYRIWISEVILQQTRVAQGLDYYRRFVDRFPDVSALAAASEEEVLRLWQGLGYYSRARNLHQAAQMVMNEFDGHFPDDYQKILLLKGIGTYTAAAIASFAFNEAYPVLDGNVMRVLSRLFAVDLPIDSNEGKKALTAIAEKLLDRSAPAQHNQAMMEIGALQCVPTHPDCPSCPLSACCSAYALHKVEDYPVKSHVTKVRDRYIVYYYIRCKETIWLHHREAKDIWHGLYDFPFVELDHEPDDAEIVRALKTILADDVDVVLHDHPVRKVHKLSHQTLHVAFLSVEIENPVPALDAYKRVSVTDWDRFPKPRLIQNYLQR